MPSLWWPLLPESRASPLSPSVCGKLSCPQATEAMVLRRCHGSGCLTHKTDITGPVPISWDLQVVPSLASPRPSWPYLCHMPVPNQPRAGGMGASGGICPMRVSVAFPGCCGWAVLAVSVGTAPSPLPPGPLLDRAARPAPGLAQRQAASWQCACLGVCTPGAGLT